MKQKRISYLFYFLWTFSLVLQANFTELFNDESYYWTFSRDLDWGYFDHPPGIAFLIRCGSYLFGSHTEIGVRIVMIILNVGTIYLIEKLSKPKIFILFYLLIASTFFLNFGFLAVPDTPLLFFTALFLHVFISYCEKENLSNSLMLLLSMVAIMYCKYHGALVILFTVMSNLKITRRISFTLIVLGALLFYFPHLFWLYKHDFVTLKYHLFDRSLDNYSVSFTLEYILSLFFALAGLNSVILIYYCFQHKSIRFKDSIYKWNFFGPLIFFLLMSFKGRVEIYWISISTIPMLIMTSQKIESISKKQIKILYSFSGITLFAILAIRLFLMIDFLPGLVGQSFEFRNQKKWAESIFAKSGHLPVVFMNSFQDASKYQFYANSEAFSLNNCMSRKNQYTLKGESELTNKTIFIIPNYDIMGLDSFKINGKKHCYKIIPNFQSYSGLTFKIISPLQPFQKNSTVNIKLTLINNSNGLYNFEANKDYPSYFSYQYFNNNKLFKDIRTPIKLTNDMIGSSFNVNIETPEISGNYVINFSIATGWLPPTINSENIRIKIE